MSRKATYALARHRLCVRGRGRIQQGILVAAIWAAAVAGAGASQTGAAPPATAPGVATELATTPAAVALRTAAAHPDENGAEVDERVARGSAVGGRAGRGEEGRRRGKNG